MKTSPFLILALLFVFLSAPCLSDAQEDDRVFGQGRFLRRIRARLTGDEYPSKANLKKDAANRAKYDALLGRTNSRSKSAKPKSKPKPKPKSKLSGPEKDRADAKSLAEERSAARTKSSSSRDRQNKSRQEPQDDPHKLIVLKSPEKARAPGFGMQLTTARGRLVVNDIQKDGMAQEAGIRKGDHLLSVGGVEIDTIQEFKEISSLLSPGDRIEVKLTRKGKPKKVLVGYDASQSPGDAPQAPSPNFKDEISSDAPNWYPSADAVRPPSDEPTPAAVNPQEIIQQQQAQILDMQRELARLRGEVIEAPASDSATSILESPVEPLIEDGPSIVPDKG